MTITYSTDRTAAASGDTLIANSFILNYIKAAPDSFVKVYLFACLQNQNTAFANDDIALALDLTEEQVVAAFEYWQQKGLIKVLRIEPMHIEFLHPNRLFDSQGSKYEGLISSLRDILGTRLLTANELKKIYDWIEIFGLNEEAVLALFMYCLDTKGQRVSINYIDSVAKTWADTGILTLTDAQEYVAKHTAFYRGAGDVVRRFGLKRSPTEDEVEMYKKWVTDYGFSAEAVLAACKDMTKATNPSFNYLDKIIVDLYEKGAVDTEALIELDKKQSKLEDFCRELFATAGIVHKPKAEEIKRIGGWLTDYHMPKEQLVLLAKQARNKSRQFDFMCKTVERWNKEDIRNAEAAQADLDRQTTKKAPTKQNFTQRKYTEEELTRFAKVFDDDTE